jgi:hypothetical protein
MLFYALVLTLLRFALCVNGTVLPRQPMSMADNKGLAKRDYPANSITAYTDIGQYICHGGDHYTWDNTEFNTCYACWEDGALWSMSSLKATDFSEGVGVYVYEDASCGTEIGWWNVPPGQDNCVTFEEPFGSFYLGPYAEP